MPKPLIKSQQKKVIILAAVAAVVAAFLYVTTQNKTLSSKNDGADKSPEQIQQQANDAGQSTNQQKTSETGQSAQPAASPGSGGGQVPLAPTGQFVSAHTLSSSGAVESVCNTSVGASCQITFVKDDGTKRLLSAQPVDASGTTHWNWTAGNILSTGTWTVTAVATKNGLSSSSSDATKLVVQ